MSDFKIKLDLATNLLKSLKAVSESDFIFNNDRAWKFVDLKMVKSNYSIHALKKVLSKELHYGSFVFLDEFTGYVCFGWTSWSAKCQYLKMHNLITADEYEKMIKELVPPLSSDGFY